MPCFFFRSPPIIPRLFARFEQQGTKLEPTARVRTIIELQENQFVDLTCRYQHTTATTAPSTTRYTMDVEAYKAEIRRSFALVEPVEAAAVFYPTLWEVNPSTKVRFKSSMW